MTAVRRKAAFNPNPVFAGHKEAFKTAYSAYCEPLRRYAVAILNNREEANEVVQDVFTAVWLNRANLDTSKLLRNYLLRAVHNNSLRLKQKEQSRRRRETAVSVNAKAATEYYEAENSLYGSEQLAPAIARLSEQSRRVLTMSYWDKKKSADIAGELSISVRTVETILYKAVRRLRSEIKKN